MLSKITYLTDYEDECVFVRTESNLSKTTEAKFYFIPIHSDAHLYSVISEV